MSRADADAATATATPPTAAAAASVQPQPQPQPYAINPVRTPEDLHAITALFAAYAASLNLDLSFQKFADEMAGLPGGYAPSRGGELLIARRRTSDGSGEMQKEKGRGDGEVVGCVALRSLSTPTPASSDADADASSLDTATTDGAGAGAGGGRVCEMKRLYTTPGTRGLGLGRALANEVVNVARRLGYSEMRLDTLPSMGPAQKLYADLGFKDIEKYCENPVDGVRYLGLDLTVDIT